MWRGTLFTVSLASCISQICTFGHWLCESAISKHPAQSACIVGLQLYIKSVFVMKKKE
jgi:uncharacterized membrane protein YccF (DUF307 family)